MSDDGCTPPTLRELHAEYLRTMSYKRHNSIDLAWRHIEACRGLLLQVEQSGKGSASMRIETKKFERLISDAESWLSAKGAAGVNPGGGGRGGGVVNVQFNVPGTYDNRGLGGGDTHYREGC